MRNSSGAGALDLMIRSFALEQIMAARTNTQADILPARRKAPPAEQEYEQFQSLADAAAAVDECRRCPLYKLATQAVFGEGPERADVMFVGEQPGDKEDLAGRPFVGPAGQVFDEIVKKVGIDRSRVYVTNAVKHFKFTPRGKRRIHQKPDNGEIEACRFWLDLERHFVQPKIVVALGGTAVRSLLGRTIPISRLRGQPVNLEDRSVLYVTNHPSYLLRIPDAEGKARERAKFAADLELVKTHMDRLEKSPRPRRSA